MRIVPETNGVFMAPSFSSLLLCVSVPLRLIPSDLQVN